MKFFKEWDKCYAKHIKGSYTEMRDYHELCMRPFTDLALANENLWKLEDMIADKKRKIPVPAFRLIALEE